MVRSARQKSHHRDCRCEPLGLCLPAEGGRHCHRRSCDAYSIAIPLSDPCDEAAPEHATLRYCPGNPPRNEYALDFEMRKRSLRMRTRQPNTTETSINIATFLCFFIHPNLHAQQPRQAAGSFVLS